MTPTQARVFGCVGWGLSDKEIGRELGVSVKTVKNHVGQLLDLHGCAGRSGLAALYQGLSRRVA